MKKSKVVAQWQPEVTLDQVLAYEHGKPETYTSSALVNAVCEQMFSQPLRLAEEVAQRMGVGRITLTHAMEMLTGHSLHDIYIEKQVKLWREYRAAHPNCKEKELAAVLGYENYNAYWRFMERNRSRFPELRDEDNDVRGHVMSVLEGLMKGESIYVRRLYSNLPFCGGKAEAEACIRLIYRHGKKVADLAEEVLRRHPELNVHRGQMREITLLQQVGIVLTDKPELHCHGRKPFERINMLSAEFLSKHQQNLAFHCAMHQLPCETQSGDTEALICYASCFYSILNPGHKRTLDEIRADLAKYGAAAVARFDELHRMFG